MAYRHLGSMSEVRGALATSARAQHRPDGILIASRCSRDIARSNPV
ncbi:MAG: hypothetical protein Ct9H300mP12_14740 [Acidimicrobiales bacterium]|nr:MAG: hypothetical protein Ct9H300mP12_14740 [Acidimicrobiales bacterium]